MTLIEKQRQMGEEEIIKELVSLIVMKALFWTFLF